MNLKHLHNTITAHASALSLDIDCISSGDVNSEIALVSDYPGTTEKQTKLVYSGNYGQQLWKTLTAYKIDIPRHAMYMTNVIKRVPAIDAENNIHMSATEVALWHEVLLRELEQLPNLKYILIMGSHALEALTHKEVISNWRGSVFHLTINDKEVLALPTFNPAYAFRKNRLSQEAESPVDERLLIMDLLKFSQLTKGKYKPYQITTNVIETIAQFNTLLTMLQYAEYISYDIEHWNKQTACIGFAIDPCNAYVVPFCDTEKSLWSIEDELYIRTKLQAFFDTASPKLIGQNCMTDATWLWYKDHIRVGPHYFDCYLAHNYLYSLLPHSLAAMTAQYTWHPYYKDEGKEWLQNGNIREYWEYNGKDCALTYYIAVNKLIPEMRMNGAFDTFMQNDMKLDWEVVKATSIGMLADIEKVHKYDVEYTQRLADRKNALEESITQQINLQEFLFIHKQSISLAAESRARKAASTENEMFELIDKKIINAVTRFEKDIQKRECPVNLSSPAHLNSLFKCMKLPNAGKSTDKYQFDAWLSSPRVSDESKNILTEIQKLRSDAKFYSTNVKVRLDEDNRCRYQYNQPGTKTVPGRLSSTKNFWGTGTNMQNQPEAARAQFIADCDEAVYYEQQDYFRLFLDEYKDSYDPYVLIYIDGEQAEARGVAYVAISPEYPDGITKWKEEFEYARLNPGAFDCHRSLASRIFNTPYDDVPKNDWNDDGTPSIRYLGKRARHGLNYRMMAETFSIRVGISLPTAQFIFKAYHSETPELMAWWKHEDNRAKVNLARNGIHVVNGPLGARMVYFSRYTKSQTEGIVAFKPQAMVGRWMKKTWVDCHNDDDWPHDKARILLNVHDALIAMARQSVAKSCLRLMVKHAEKPIPIGNEELIIPASCAMSVADEFGKHRWSGLKKIKL